MEQTCYYTIIKQHWPLWDSNGPNTTTNNCCYASCAQTCGFVAHTRRWNLTTGLSNFQWTSFHIIIFNLCSRRRSRQSVRLGWKRLTNIRSNWMFTSLLFTITFLLWSFSLRTGWTSVVLRSSPRICRACNRWRASRRVCDDVLVWSFRRLWLQLRFQPCGGGGGGWMAAGVESVLAAKVIAEFRITVSYIAAIVFLSASISSYVTCWERCKVVLFFVSRYVWVVGHKRFSCLMLLVWKGGCWASVVPAYLPQITATFLCLIFF